MSDTPRTDEQINGKPGTRFEYLAGDSLRNALVPSEFCRQLERELNAANDRIKRLEKELTDTKRKQSVLVSDVVLYEDRGERIKQMEEVGDEMLNWLTDDGISVENLRLIANAWRKAKEAKL